MTLNEILKEILDNIPKTDFKEIYAGGLYRRLEKETDPDVKNSFRRRSIPYRSLMRTNPSLLSRK